jgi:hypothetical protein
LINYVKANNPSIYSNLTIAIVDAIFNVGSATPRDQMILAQLTGLELNLAITATQGTCGAQFNTNICLGGVLNVSSIPGATALFGTSTPTIGQVVGFVTSKWIGTLTTNRSDWKFNLTTSQEDTVISTLSGVNQGTLIVSSGCP